MASGYRTHQLVHALRRLLPDPERHTNVVGRWSAALDSLIHRFHRSATELCKFCGSTGSQWLQAARALSYCHSACGFVNQELGGVG